MTSTVITKGQIGKQDFYGWEGSSAKTFTRTNSVGESMVLNKVDWVGVDALQTFGGGVLATDVTIQAALTAIGTSQKVELFLSPQTWTISNNLDMTSYPNVVLKAPSGCLFSVASGKTLTLYSPSNIIASPIQQIFSGAGVVAWTKGGTVYSEWWGAKGDGTTDDTTAIVAAGTSLSVGGKLQFIAGKTYIHNGSSTTYIPVYSHVTISGYGAILKQLAGPYTTDRLFIGNTAIVTYLVWRPFLNNVTIEGLELDGNYANVTTTASAGGLLIEQAYNLTIRDLYIHDLAGVSGAKYGILFGHSTGVRVSGCRVYNTDRQCLYSWESKEVSVTNCNLSTSRYREAFNAGCNSPMDLQQGYAEVSNTYMYNVATANAVDVVRLSGIADQHFSNCTFESDGTLPGIRFAGLVTERVFVDNCRFYNTLYGIKVESTGGAEIRVSNSKFDTQVNGVYILDYDIDYFSMIGCSITNSSDKPMITGGTANTRMTIVGNHFDTGTRINVGSVGQLIFSENIISNMSDANYAVLVIGTAGTHNATVIGNRLFSNTINKLYVNCSGIAYGNSTPDSVIDGAAVKYQHINQKELDLSTDTGSGVAWSSGYPSNSNITVIAEVTELVTFAGGGATWQLGDSVDHDRWGAGYADTVGTKAIPSSYTAGDSAVFFVASATQIRVKPNAGTFTGGKILITVFMTRL